MVAGPRSLPIPTLTPTLPSAAHRQAHGAGVGPAGQGLPEAQQHGLGGMPGSGSSGGHAGVTSGVTSSVTSGVSSCECMVQLTLVPLRRGVQRLPALLVVSEADGRPLDSVHDVQLLVR